MDLYAIFRFLGKRVVRPLHDINEFKVKIAGPLKGKRTKTALARLQIVLRAIMLRRTKTMTVDGKPLLTLPKREVIVVKGPFLDECVAIDPPLQGLTC
jgi:SNF2 family DNA or RNA helicase